MYIKGVGMTKFGIEQCTSQDLVYDSSIAALEDCEMSMDDIDAVILSNNDITSNGERQRHSASMVSSLLQAKIPILTVPAGCAGGGNALWAATQIQTSNPKFKNILVVGFEKMVSNLSVMSTDEMLMGTERIYEQTEGLIFPAENAIVAQQYMLKYGLTMDDLALVALKNHENAYLNPHARFYKKKVTLEQIQNSPVVASPLRLFDCSIPANGAAALVLSTEKTDIEVVGACEESDLLAPFERKDMTTWDATVKAAQQAFKQADIPPRYIDIAEIHDAFTPVELISYEDVGFCKKGEAKELIRSNETKINGKLPVNTSGGLKAKGHPISATGASQIYELVKQMRKQAGDRQVEKKINYALAQNIGGAGSTVTVHVLKNHN